MSPPKNYRLICPALNLHPERSPANLLDNEVAYFNSIPWAAALISAPGTIPFIPPCRNPISPLRDQLFGSTLSNARSIPHLLCTFHAENIASAGDPRRPILKTVTFVAVGDGVSGYENVVHGGIVASLMDEAMGAMFELNATLRKDLPTFKTDNVTAGLDVTYLKPVNTNRVLCITSTVEEMSGRKTRITSQVADENEDVLAKCSSRWVSLKPKSKL